MKGVRKLNRIKYFRKEMGMTIRELAIKSSIAPGYISELENDAEGQKNPSKDVMVRISEVLGRTVPEVFFPEN